MGLGGDLVQKWVLTGRESPERFVPFLALRVALRAGLDAAALRAVLNAARENKVHARAGSTRLSGWRSPERGKA